MMTLIFSDLADSIHKIERLFEVGKAEFAVDVMLIGYRPLRDTSVDALQLFSMKWRHAASAGNTVFVG